ncbi:hypothetical protein HDU82_005793 [Entophlyctis luteolus]|nr:hypothetical protein HDU82_005793 [Entophlyctis luteolus]
MSTPPRRQQSADSTPRNHILRGMSGLSFASTTKNSSSNGNNETFAIETPDLRNEQEGNEFSESWFDFLTLRGSVLSNVFLPAAFFSLWGAGWTCVYMLSGWLTLFPNSQALITVISFGKLPGQSFAFRLDSSFDSARLVLALILGYRTNAAYDRYWEARKVWSTLVSHSRNLSRAIWCSTNTQGDKQNDVEKLGAINLVLAFSVSTKHYLRDQPGHQHDDLAQLLVHVPKFSPGSSLDSTAINIPVEIVMLLTEYVRVAEEKSKAVLVRTSSY